MNVLHAVQSGNDSGTSLKESDLDGLDSDDEAANDRLDKGMDTTTDKGHRLNLRLILTLTSIHQHSKT